MNSTNKSYTFNNFIGEDNLKTEIIINSVRLKQPTYNPIFIYGAVGTGKTHFAHALYNCYADNNDSSKSTYFDCESFINKYIDSVKNNNTSEFIESLTHLELLIIDDIHLLSGKEKTQGLLIQIFDVFHISKKQLVFISAHTPEELVAFEPALKSRMLSGLQLEFSLPDFKNRFDILKLKNRENQLGISDDILKIIAEKENLSGRVLEAVLLVIKYKFQDIQKLKKEDVIKLMEKF